MKATIKFIALGTLLGALSACEEGEPTIYTQPEPSYAQAMRDNTGTYTISLGALDEVCISAYASVATTTTPIGSARSNVADITLSVNDTDSYFYEYTTVFNGATDDRTSAANILNVDPASITYTTLYLDTERSSTGEPTAIYIEDSSGDGSYRLTASPYYMVKFAIGEITSTGFTGGFEAHKETPLGSSCQYFFDSATFTAVKQ